MVPPPFAAEPGHWFLRGVQSAVFYYISCTPWVERKHKRKRRREAKEQAHERSGVVVTQPGRVRQPAPFQTNEAWAEELMLGPGPPKGWKKDTLLAKLQSNVHKGPGDSDGTSSTPEPEMPGLHPHPTESSTTPTTDSTVLPTEASTRPSTADETGEQGPSNEKSASIPTRPPIERRFSSAMENLKESMRISLHPPKWNWKRYDREDEILDGFTEKMTRIWNRATSAVHYEGTAGQEQPSESTPYRRKRALTNESDRYDYYRARHPEVNDMHPPVVSQLPLTRAEAAWMLLPPPSAAVMEARTRPAAEPEMRWPLCVIGRPLKETDPKVSFAKTRSTEHVNSRDFAHSSDEAEDEDVSVDGRDDRNEDDYFRDHEVWSDQQRPTRVKHLSDPIIKPPSVHPASRIAGDLFIPKRRDSWRFHYVVPSNQPMEG
ncbi:hypothetical protein H2200_007972 [Cladophialophora chaetospira]|uniref:Uncharacterized protein n=1 Tax=Cladophialophora chaetospira TaxID=386627 RepID=A0AA38X6W8_9EURO|nr:hypothetical protein H2200_007972 [Cladophialophora chaetospira]